MNTDEFHENYVESEPVRPSPCLSRDAISTAEDPSGHIRSMLGDEHNDATQLIPVFVISFSSLSFIWACCNISSSIVPPLTKRMTVTSLHNTIKQ